MHSTTKCAKFSKELLAYMDSQPENSVNLVLMISYNCLSQTGQGFEEFVNKINTDQIRKKIRKLNVVDTSYLYRHTIPAFKKYSNSNIKTGWFEENEESLKELKVNTEIVSWAPFLNTEQFNKHYEQIIKDFKGDENGNGIVQSFRDTVISEGAIFSYKIKTDIANCIDFILEECAQMAAFFYDGMNLLYPMKMTGPLSDIIERYNIKINHFRYRTSVQNHDSDEELDLEGLNREIVSFVKNKVTNVNFFIIDKHGNHIYKNKAYESIVGTANFGRLDPESWKNSLEVMKSKKQKLFEEKYSDMLFLSLKAPLIINDKVEGVIGMAIDITDKKKAEELAKQNELQKIQLEKQAEFKTFVGQLAHDIAFPISALDIFIKKHGDFCEKDHIILRDIISKIKSISGLLLDRYKQDEKLGSDFKKQYILVPLSLSSLIDQKRAQTDGSNIKILFEFDPADNFSFIVGDQVSFSRMMSNLLNNAVEAVCTKCGHIKITMKTDDEHVIISVEDNGVGIPEELIKQILDQKSIGSTKKQGSGIGLKQIMETVSLYGWKIDITNLGTGTRFTITCPKAYKPDYIVDEISLRKGTTAVVLDDDPLVFSMWNNKIAAYKNDINIKFFTDCSEASAFIDNFPKEDKSKLFLFSDYDLRNQCTDGIWFALENGMQDRSIIVSCINNDLSFQEKLEKSKLKFFPKQFLSTVNLKVCNM